MYSIIQKIYEKNNKVLKERLRNVLKISEKQPIKTLYTALYWIK